MKRKTRATPANTPRSRSKRTRRERKSLNALFHSITGRYCTEGFDIDSNTLFDSILRPLITPMPKFDDICTVTPMENKQ